MEGGQKPLEIQLTFPDHLRGGVYANNMSIAHTREEFVLDFLMVAPPAGSLTARVILSPGHAKRVAAALVENLRKYEETFGALHAAEEPRGRIGVN